MFFIGTRIYFTKLTLTLCEFRDPMLSHGGFPIMLFMSSLQI